MGDRLAQASQLLTEPGVSYPLSLSLELTLVSRNPGVIFHEMHEHPRSTTPWGVLSELGPFQRDVVTIRRHGRLGTLRPKTEAV